jgi:hypothetical protein
MMGQFWLNSKETLLRTLPEVTQNWGARGQGTTELRSKTLIRFLRKHNTNTIPKGSVVGYRFG